MNMFMKGDLLECIDDNGQSVLKAGTVYTCLWTVGDKVAIAEYKRYNFKQSRFVKVGEVSIFR